MTWLYVPSTCSPSAQESADSNSASSSPCPTPDAWLMSKGRVMRHRSLCAAWKRGGFIRALSGLTSKPSTAARGVASWIASLAATRANPSPSPVRVSPRRTPDTSGPTSDESSGKSRRRGHSSRTSPTIYLRASTRSTMTWKQWVTALRRACSQRKKSVRATFGSDSSFWLTIQDSRWPTPDASVAQEGEGPETWLARRAVAKAKGYNGNGIGTPLSMAAVLWPVTVRDIDLGLWPTMTVSDSTKGAEDATTKEARGAGWQDLVSKASIWPTPCVPNGGRSPKPGTYSTTGKRADGSKKCMTLEERVKMWPTVTARDHRSPNSSESQERRNAGSKRGQQLVNFVAYHFSLQDQKTSNSGDTSSPTRRALNPLFAEWLMGWPTGWTACEPVETASFHSWLAMRGALYLLLSATESTNMAA